MADLCQQVKKEVGGQGEVVKTRRDLLCSTSAAVAALVFCSNRAESAHQEAPPTQRGRDRSTSRRSDKSRAVLERMQYAGIDERLQLVNELRTQRHQEMIDRLRDELDISEAEWPLVKPRIEAIYTLRNAGGTGEETDVGRTRKALRSCLDRQESKSTEVRTAMKHYRQAKEKSRQEMAGAQARLRELMTLRQEALLLLRGLLD